MKWGCHTFGGMQAIFAVYSGSGIKTRVEIIKKLLTTPGIIGFVYSNEYGRSDSLEKEIETMGNYGIVHGNINCEQHNYYRCEDEPLGDELKSKLMSDIKFYENRKKEIGDWYEWNSKRIDLELDSIKYRLKNERS